MDIEKEINNLQNQKRTELLGIAIKTGATFYIANQSKEIIRLYNENQSLITPSSIEALETKANYLTKGFLWLDEKVSTTYRSIRGIEPPNNEPLIQEHYIDAFPYVATTLMFGLALNNARNKIRNINILQYLLR